MQKVLETSNECADRNAVHMNLALLQHSLQNSIVVEGGSDLDIRSLLQKQSQLQAKLKVDQEAASALARSSLLTEPSENSRVTATNYRLFYTSDCNSGPDISPQNYRKACDALCERLQSIIELNEFYLARISYSEKVLQLKDDLMLQLVNYSPKASLPLQTAVSKFLHVVEAEGQNMPAAARTEPCVDFAQFEENLRFSLQILDDKVSKLKGDHDDILANFKSSRFAMRSAIRSLQACLTCSEDQIDTKVSDALQTLQDCLNRFHLSHDDDEVFIQDPSNLQSELRLSIPRSSSSEDDMVTCPSEAAEDVVTCLNQVRDKLSRIVLGPRFSEDDLRSTNARCDDLERKLKQYKLRNEVISNQLRALQRSEDVRLQEHAGALLAQLDVTIDEWDFASITQGLTDSVTKVSLDLLSSNNRLLRERNEIISSQAESLAKFEEDVGSLEYQLVKLRQKLAEKESLELELRDEISNYQNDSHDVPVGKLPAKPSTDVTDATDPVPMSSRKRVVKRPPRMSAAGSVLSTSSDDEICRESHSSCTCSCSESDGAASPIDNGPSDPDSHPASPGRSSRDSGFVTTDIHTQTEAPPVFVCGSERATVPRPTGLHTACKKTMPPSGVATATQTHVSVTHRSTQTIACPTPRTAPSTFSKYVQVQGICTEEDFTRLQNELDKSTAEVKSKSQELSDLQRQKENLQSRLELKEKAIQDLLNDHDAAVKALDTEVEKWKGLAAARPTEPRPSSVNDETGSLFSDRGSLDQSMEWNDLYDCLQLSKARQSELGQSLNESRGFSADLKRRLLEADQEKLDMTAELSALEKLYGENIGHKEKHIQHLKNELERFSGKLAALQADVQDRATAYDAQQKSLEKLRAELEEVNRQHEVTREEKAAVQIRLDEFKFADSPSPSYRHKYESVLVELEQAKSKMELRAIENLDLQSKLSASVESGRLHNSDLERAVEHLKFREASLLKDIQELTAENRELKTLTDAAEGSQYWKGKCEDVQARLDGATREMDDLRSTLCKTEELAAELKEAKERANILVADKRRLYEALDVEVKEKDELTKKRSEIAEAVAQLKKEKEALNGEFEDWKSNANTQFSHMVRDYEERLRDYQVVISGRGASGPTEVAHGETQTEQDAPTAIHWDDRMFTKLPLWLQKQLIKLRNERMSVLEDLRATLRANPGLAGQRVLSVEDISLLERLTADNESRLHTSGIASMDHRSGGSGALLTAFSSTSIGPNDQSNRFTARLSINPDSFKNLPRDIQRLLVDLAKENDAVLQLLEQTLTHETPLPAEIEMKDASCQVRARSENNCEEHRAEMSSLSSQLLTLRAEVDRKATDCVLLKGHLDETEQKYRTYKRHSEQLHSAAKKTLEELQKELREQRVQNEALSRRMSLWSKKDDSEIRHLTEELHRTQLTEQHLNIRLEQSEKNARADQEFMAQLRLQNENLASQLQRTEEHLQMWSDGNCPSCEDLKRRVLCLKDQKNYLLSRLHDLETVHDRALYSLAMMGAPSAVTIVHRRQQPCSFKSVVWAIMAARWMAKR